MKPTHASLAIAVVLTVGVLVVPAAGAHAQKAEHAAPRVFAARRVQVQLLQARTALAHATAKLGEIQGELASSHPKATTLQRQTSQLEQALSRTKARLDAVGSRFVTLEAQLEAFAEPVAVAAKRVRDEVAYVQGGVPRYSRAQLLSQAAMDYVAGHVSDTVYGYLLWFHKKIPSSSAKSALRAQAGICTGAAVSLGTIMHRLGFKVRSVNFYYVDPPPISAADGHVAVEVRYDGAWHFFDPTFGLFWTDANGKVLSVSQVRAGLGSMQKNFASFTNVFEDAVFGNDAWFVTDPKTRIAYHATTLISKH